MSYRNALIEVIEWSVFKTVCITTKQLPLQYTEDIDKYDVYAIDSGAWHIVVPKGTADALDFETNYKATANAKDLVLQSVVITDPVTPAYQAGVDSSGRLLVSQEPPAPANTTPINGIADSVMTGVVDTYFVLHTTEDSGVQKFIGGGAGKNGGHKIELFEDPSGTGSPLNLIAKAFIPETGGNFSFDLNEYFTANGTRRLLIRRTRFLGGSAEIFAKWSGYRG